MPEIVAPDNTQLDPSSGGGLDALMRDLDWSQSPLGLRDTWSSSLRTTVGMLLTARAQVVLFWGAHFVALYNDAYAPTIGDKHPRALGRPACENWAELWGDLEPLLKGVRETGRTFAASDRPFYIERHGYGETAYFDVSYSAVPEADGSVGGVLCIVSETTRRVVSARRQASLLQLEDSLRNISAAPAARQFAVDLLRQELGAETVRYADQEASGDALAMGDDAPSTSDACVLDIPVSRNNQKVGAFVVQYPAARRWDDEDRQFARSVAERTWSASERARAEDELHLLNRELGERVAQVVAQREAALARVHEMQKLETIGQLTGGVAHDFNNLLTPIVGALDMVARLHEGDERIRKLTGAGLQAAERARTLVQRLLAFARRQHLQARPVNVRQLVNGMEDLLTRSLGPQIVLKIESEASLPPAMMDPNQFELALLNLAVNARDAMPEGGTLTIAVGQQSMAHKARLPEGRYIRVSVSDTGSGMDEETIKRAVEPFFTTKAKGQGTGLGLSMVHGLAAQSGGDFALTSVPGRGTTATLWLPAATASLDDSTPQATSTPALRRGQGAAVLLVDDEELVRSGTAEMLIDAGYLVRQASSGHQALALLRDGLDVAVLITDYAMPGMTGAQLASEAVQLRPALPVLVITGFASLNDNTVIDLPRLSKPFRQVELADVLADLLEKSEQH